MPLPFKDKMFREKPYTSCFDCIQSQKLKCKNCMQILIADILNRRNHLLQNQKQSLQDKELEYKHKFKLNPMRQSDQFFHKRSTQQASVEINSNFGLWMNHIKSKRITTSSNDQEEYDPLRATLVQWPHKLKAKKHNFSTFSKPKFEKWENKIASKLEQYNKENHLAKQRNLAKIMRSV